jgi:Na+-transporting methylmalonyl-CoA/oxaloacetate decarboxylase gamma subunit
MNGYMVMIQEGNGWYAMWVGLAVVFTALFLVSTVITLTGLFFRKREVWKRRRAQGANGFAAVADAISEPPPPVRTVDDPDDDTETGSSTEEELVAAAVAVALGLQGGFRVHAIHLEEVDENAGSWKLAGRMHQHGRVRRSR